MAGRRVRVGPDGTVVIPPVRVGPPRPRRPVGGPGRAERCSPSRLGLLARSGPGPS